MMLWLSLLRSIAIAVFIAGDHRFPGSGFTGFRDADASVIHMAPS